MVPKGLGKHVARTRSGTKGMRHGKRGERERGKKERKKGTTPNGNEWVQEAGWNKMFKMNEFPKRIKGKGE